jgi:hypothetical protein
MGVKRLLAIVTAESDIVELLCKMPHIFTNAAYVDVPYVYSCCSGCATADVEEYRQRFPVHRIPDHRVFSKVFNTLCECGTLPSAHVSSEQARKQHVKEQENILEMVQRNPTTSIRRLFTRLGVSRTRVWRTLHEDGLCPFHPQHVKIYTQGAVPCILNFVIGYLMITNCFLFTDKATFTRNGINNTYNSHRWSHNNSHGTAETYF